MWSTLMATLAHGINATIAYHPQCPAVRTSFSLSLSRTRLLSCCRWMLSTPVANSVEHVAQLWSLLCAWHHQHRYLRYYGDLCTACISTITRLHYFGLRTCIASSDRLYVPTCIPDTQGVSSTLNTEESRDSILFHSLI